MDLMTQLPQIEFGHDAILVSVDCMGKIVHLALTTYKVSAEGIATLLIIRYHVVRMI